MSSKSSNYNETDFKAATVEWLSEKGYLQHDAVLINELPISNFNRRVDLVVANGKLHAFEIKSDVDTTQRLVGQIQTYLEYFDKVSVVCPRKFVDFAKFNLPPEVEIIQLDFKDGKAKTTIKQRGKTKLIDSIDKYLSFMTKKELIAFIKSQNLACHIGESRLDLYHKVSSLPIKIWRNAVLASLKIKYSPGSAHLKRKDSLNIKNNFSFIDSENDFIQDFWIKDHDKNNNRHVIDISESMAKNGFVTNHAIQVIPRALKR